MLQQLTQHYAFRRVLQLVPVLFGISLVTFFLMQLMPSDPATVILRTSDVPITPETIAAMREELGLDRPLLVQYLDWLWRVLHLDFGRSFVTDEPVLRSVFHYAPTTLMLTTCATALILIIALPMGILAALYRDSWFDHVSRGFAYVGTALPNFWLGFLLLYWFSYKLGWFSVTSRGSLTDWILPAITLAWTPAAVYARLLRSSMLDSLSQNYVLYAKARGLLERLIVSRYVLKNALLPVVTIFSLSIAQLLSGTVIVESIFALPGLGRFAVESILNRDYPVVQCYVCLTAMLFVVINLMIDLTYTYLDPRIRFGRQED